MAYFLALLAAFTFGLGTVLQQKGALETGGDEAAGARFLTRVFRQPVWLLGGLCQAAGWILQAVALDRGSLIVVQSLTTLSLVIALPLGRRITGQVITGRLWFGAVAMVVGIAMFLSTGSPSAGASSPSAAAWWVAGALSVVVIVVLARAAQKLTSSPRAMVLGSAAGICYALQASVTKVFVRVVSGGLHAVLHSWTTYALIVSALVGFALQQSALKTGVLAPAMASSNAVTLFASVIYGITVFGERLSPGAEHLTTAIAGLGAALVGLVLLSGAKPPPMPVVGSGDGAPDAVGGDRAFRPPTDDDTGAGAGADR